MESEASAATSSPSAPNAFTLVVKVLVSGQQRDSLHIVGLTPDNTIGQLKSHIQTLLQEHPSPARQRLMYSGHELRDQNASLQDALKLQDVATHAPVLHLVVREDFASASSTTPSPLPQPSNTLPNIPATHTHPHMQAHLAQMAQARMAMQTQLQMLQNQTHQNHHNLAHHNTGHVPNSNDGNQTVHPSLPVGPNVIGAGQPLPGFAGSGPRMHSFNGQPPITVGPGIPGGPHIPAIPADMLAQMQRMNTPGVQNAAHDGQSTPSLPGPRSDLPQTDARAPSPPPPGPMTTQVHENVLPNGQRVRTVVSTATVNYQFSTNANAIPAQRAPLQLSPLPIPNPGFPHPPTNAAHYPYPFVSAQQQRPQPSDPTAWLLSSPRGPEALLFAPGHGYFSSRTSRFTPLNIPSARSTSSAAAPAPTPTVAAEPVNANRDQPAAGVPGQQMQPVGQAQPAPNQQANQEQNDIFNLIVNRGWLFLRLYLFTFVFSEPGTWRRTILLVIATIMCLLPQDNPINAAVVAVRQHIDNLIGLPQRDGPLAQRRQEQQNQDEAQRNEQGGHQQRPRSHNTAAQATPEEAARRLLRRRDQQNPNVIMNMLRSIERAVALFLASLIPGVGERYVRAREEEREAVRREEQRQEEERRNTEESSNNVAAENSTSPASQNDIGEKKNEHVSPVTNGVDANSTGVEAGSSSGEVRSRVVGTAEFVENNL